MRMGRRLLALLLLVVLAARVVDERGEARCCAHRNRELLDRWARIRDEVRHLEGEVAHLRRTDRLLDVARRAGLEAGARGGEVRRAPAPGARNRE